MVTRRARLKRLWKLFAIGLAIAFLALNAVAWNQAWAMTHYASGGERTVRPEALTLSQKALAVAVGVSVPRPRNLHTPQDVGLSYETHAINPGEGQIIETWYAPHPGSRGIVLMFPGYAESKASLLAPGVALHELGYSLLLVDFRGAGGSSGSDTTLGVSEAKDVAATVAYALGRWPGQPLVLYGVSMGSAAVLRAVAVEGVRPEAVILESPFDRLLATVRNRFDATGLPTFPGAELVVLWGSVQHAFNGFTHNPVDYAPSVECPVLLLHGDRDPRVTTEQVMGLYGRLPGEKRTASFPGAGHESLFSTTPQAWEEHVSRFLGEVEERRE